MALDKLVDSGQLDTDLTAIANAIRTKGGTSAQLAFPSEFVSAINAISGGGGGGLEYETGTYTPASDTTSPTISFAKTHTNRPICVMLSDTSFSSFPSSTVAAWWFNVLYDISNATFNNYYARKEYYYRTSTSNSTSGQNMTSLDNESSNSSVAYYLKNDKFCAYASSQYSYRSGRTYKWLAIWGPTT